MSVRDLVEESYHSKLFIGGEWISPSTDARIRVVNPSTEETVLTVPEAQEADVERAIAAARHAFDTGPWPRMTPVERSVFLTRIGARLGECVDEISSIWAKEMGIVYPLAQLFTGSVKGTFDDYAALGTTFPFVEEHRGTGAGGLSLLVREPVGVVGAIIPWNAPIVLIAYKVAPALLAGCTVVIKASPEAPGEAYLLADMCREVGLPAGVVNVITADRAASEHLVRGPQVDKISFTGSTAAGRRIAALCGDRMARFTLELGGKSAAIIADDYDVVDAANAIAQFSCMFTGQMCSALTRFIIRRDRHDRFVAALAEAFSQTKLGDPFDSGVQMGPLAMERQRTRVEQCVARGTADGSTIACGGGRPRAFERGYYFEPTVFGNVNPKSALAQDEIFGPVLSVIPASDEDEAIAIANDSLYGLNASVFTHDVHKAYRIARQIRSGTVGHNSVRADFKVAFGGCKYSGVGREGGVEGLRPYLESKTIILESDVSYRG